MASLFVDRADVQAVLTDALDDPDPLVRFAAAGALDPRTPEIDAALDPLLKDPVRAVRVAAARALRGRRSPEAALAKDYASYLAYNSDQPTALHERGTWYLLHGRTGRAIVDLQRAVALDPGSPAHHDSLAVAYSTDGRHADAAQALTKAVALAPDDADLRYRLALAQGATGDLAAAEASLTQAVTMNPAHARAWYNLAVIRKQLGQPNAEEAVRRAVELSPDDERVRALIAP
jgi:Flp pilus assembly protein TadD